jgi:short subunit dehydrogenase-like uncharacterized protein
MLMIYGAAGYTGGLIAREARRRGLPLVIAGRDGARLGALARELGCESRSFGLEDADRAAAELRGVSVLLNCAGPFIHTLPPLLGACLQTGAHYLDLAGEAEEHGLVAARDAELRERGVMAMPGVGFGVVPTDCAAALAAQKVPNATSLVIAYDTRGGASKGTLRTVLPSIHRTGVKRSRGVLVPARPGEQTRRMDLGAGPSSVVTNPWRADLVAAFASTGVPTIETYSTFPFAARLLMKLGWFLDTGLGKALVRAMIASAPEGPSTAERERGATFVVAEASDGTRSARVTIRGPEAYEVTIASAVAVAARVLEGAALAGHATPSKVLGPDFVASLPGMEIEA